MSESRDCLRELAEKARATQKRYDVGRGNRSGDQEMRQWAERCRAFDLFVAAASPDVVLALLDERDALREALEVVLPYAEDWDRIENVDEIHYRKYREMIQRARDALVPSRREAP